MKQINGENEMSMEEREKLISSILDDIMYLINSEEITHPCVPASISDTM